MRLKISLHISLIILFILIFPYNGFAQETCIESNHYGETFTEIVQATTTKNGKMITKCDNCNEIVSTDVIYRVKTISLTPKTYTYDGARKSPIIKVYDSKGKLIPTNCYRISNLTNRKTVGVHTYKLTFRGNYKGTKKASFTINPKETAFASVVKKKNSLTFKWKKISKQADGYEIKYSVNKKALTKSSKAFIIKNYKTTSKKINHLKSKKKYYAKIRTYKIVNGKKYYSNWSKIVSAKTL